MSLPEMQQPTPAPSGSAKAGKPAPERHTLRRVIQVERERAAKRANLIFSTLRDIVLQPEKVVQAYLNGKYKKYYNPFRLFVFSSALLSFVVVQIYDKGAFSEVMRSASGGGGNESLNMMLVEGITRYFSALLWISVPMITLAATWFYKSKGWYYGEHLVLHFYLYSVLNLLYIPHALINSKALYGEYDWRTGIYLVLMLVIYARTYQRMFQLSWIQASLRGLLTYIVGTLLYIIFTGIVGAAVGIVFAIYMKNSGQL